MIWRLSFALCFPVGTWTSLPFEGKGSPSSNLVTLQIKIRQLLVCDGLTGQYLYMEKEGRRPNRRRRRGEKEEAQPGGKGEKDKRKDNRPKKERRWRGEEDRKPNKLNGPGIHDLNILIRQVFWDKQIKRQTNHFGMEGVLLYSKKCCFLSSIFP